ncbi:MAG: hypothetical protein AAGI72_05080 [Pseudomonadota bacterium]
MAKKKTHSKTTIRRAAKTMHASAPRKTGSKKPDADASRSTHKARANWFNAREAWPLREAPLSRLLNARAGAMTALAPLPGVPPWEQAGPTNVGGRSTSIVVDPNDVQRIWIGAAGGGVWFSEDGGIAWTPQWHAEPTLNIGSLCLDPANANHILCGTGEANLSADSHAGVGVYESNDGGAHWHLLAGAESHGLPRRIGRVAIDPFNSNRIMAAGVGHRPEDARGLFLSTDAGVSWAAVGGIFSGPFQCHEVVFHPTQNGTIYTAIDAAGMSSGIWRSTDGGLSWTQLRAGLPHPSFMRRTSLAIAPSDPNVIYAQVATGNGGVEGVFRTVNGGNTWRSIGGNHFSDERQMNYNNTISVDPGDADIVVCGGVDLHRTRNGGNTWTQLTRWFAERGVDTDYAHADQHFIVHPPGQPGLVYAANDGGLDVSTDGGRTWENRSNGLATNMFYDLASAATSADFYGGGMQDNGTWLTTNGVPGEFIETTGGDGGFCAIDPNDALHLFTSSQFMRINRFRRSDGWAQDIGPNETGSRPWMAFIAMDPDRPRRVFVGSQRVWRSSNDGNSWSDRSGVLDGSFVTCIEISRADTDVIYVGTENGGIFKSDDGGLSWSGNIASSSLPGRTVTRLRTPADSTDVVYATVANFGNPHLFRSTDGGSTWEDVDACHGSLPDVPHHGIVIPASDSDTLYVCSDAGVFVSVNGGASWNNLSGNLPTVMVVDLVLHEASQTLFAATYGRSTWKLDVSAIG